MSSAFILESRNRIFFQCLFRFLEDLLRAHDRLENTQQVLLAIRYLDSILVDTAYVERYIPNTIRCGVSLYIQHKVQTRASDKDAAVDKGHGPVLGAGHLLHLETEQVRLGTADRPGVIAILLVKGCAALVERLNCRLTPGLVVIVSCEAVCLFISGPAVWPSCSANPTLNRTLVATVSVYACGKR